MARCCPCPCSVCECHLQGSSPLLPAAARPDSALLSAPRRVREQCHAPGRARSHPPAPHGTRGRHQEGRVAARDTANVAPRFFSTAKLHNPPPPQGGWDAAVSTREQPESRLNFFFAQRSQDTPARGTAPHSPSCKTRSERGASAASRPGSALQGFSLVFCTRKGIKVRTGRKGREEP